MVDPEFWQNRAKAEEKSKELDKLKEDLFKWEKIEKSISDCLEVAKIDKDDQSVNLKKEIEKQFSKIERQLNDFEKLTFLNKE